MCDLRPPKPEDYLNCDYQWRYEMIEARRWYDDEYALVMERKS